MYIKNWEYTIFFRCSCVAANQHLAYYSSFGWFLDKQERKATFGQTLTKCQVWVIPQREN